MIYMAYNPISEKYYIGQAVDFEQRKSAHKSQSKLNKDKCYFHRAIRKYGFYVFEWSILSEEDSKDKMDLLERLYICIFKSYDRRYGYNLTIGGEGSVGFKHSRESIQKIRDSRKGDKNPNFGKPISDSLRRAIIEANKNRVWSAESRKKKGDSQRGEKNHRFGKPVSEEQKALISRRNKGNTWGFKKKVEVQ